MPQLPTSCDSEWLDCTAATTSCAVMCCAPACLAGSTHSCSASKPTKATSCASRVLLGPSNVSGSLCPPHTAMSTLSMSIDLRASSCASLTRSAAVMPRLLCFRSCFSEKYASVTGTRILAAASTSLMWITCSFSSGVADGGGGAGAAGAAPLASVGGGGACIAIVLRWYVLIASRTSASQMTPSHAASSSTLSLATSIPSTDLHPAWRYLSMSPLKSLSLLLPRRTGALLPNTERSGRMDPRRLLVRAMAAMDGSRIGLSPAFFARLSISARCSCDSCGMLALEGASLTSTLTERSASPSSSPATSSSCIAVSLRSPVEPDFLMLRDIVAEVMVAAAMSFFLLPVEIVRALKPLKRSESFFCGATAVRRRSMRSSTYSGTGFSSMRGMTVCRNAYKWLTASSMYDGSSERLRRPSSFAGTCEMNTRKFFMLGSDVRIKSLNGSIYSSRWNAPFARLVRTLPMSRSEPVLCVGTDPGGKRAYFSGAITAGTMKRRNMNALSTLSAGGSAVSSFMPVSASGPSACSTLVRINRHRRRNESGMRSRWLCSAAMMLSQHSCSCLTLCAIASGLDSLAGLTSSAAGSSRIALSGAVKVARRNASPSI
eukprot:Unigene3802_Nuclearia_a/m.11588 Unigene3802_Nuclearia_a/g.11588  ORF Unigene3802_Nuclearia_a/g.11588 Unigene3802_Nuclearia_a/m.11588 type:complete len:603 (-) Unigene3802_Nuclearia_a:163-1971(-)